MSLPLPIALTPHSTYLPRIIPTSTPGLCFCCGLAGVGWDVERAEVYPRGASLCGEGLGLGSGLGLGFGLEVDQFMVRGYSLNGTPKMDSSRP